MNYQLLSQRWFHIFLGCAVSGGLLVWLAYTIDWHEVLKHCRNLHYIIFIPATILLGIHFWLRALRWHWLLPKSDLAPSKKHLIEGIMVGNFATFVLPLRAGEFIRPYYLTLKARVPFPVSFASIVIERFFDLMTVLGSFAVMVMILPDIPAWAHNGALILGGLALGILGFILIGSFLPKQLLGGVSFISRILPPSIAPKIVNMADQFLSSTRVLHSPLALSMVILYTLGVWGSCYVVYYVFFFLFDFGGSFGAGVSVAVIIALAVAAPSLPGFIGVYQTACVAAFSLFGWSDAAAVAYAIITHLFQFLLFIVCGLIILLREGLSLADLKRSSDSPNRA